MAKVASNVAEIKKAQAMAESLGQATEIVLPSFGKELFLGHFRLDLIAPFPEEEPAVAAETAAYLEKIRQVCETEWREVGPEIERTGVVPEYVVKGLADLGAFGMKIPKDYGGLGLSQVAYNKALALVTQVHSSLGVLLSAHQSIGVPQPLKSHGSEEQKRKYLPRCAQGAITACLLTEPNTGTDLAHTATTAVPTEDDEAYILNGVKLWTTNGVIAELVVVLASIPRSETHRGGLSTFIVELDSPGITVERRNEFMGLRGIENGVTRFHDVRVPKENLLGKEGKGLAVALSTLNVGRLSIPGMSAGAGKWSTKVASEWVAARSSMGKPIGKYEAIASKVSFMAATTFALDAMQEMTSIMADQKRNDIRVESAIAKLFASEMGWRIADELVQVRGGRGYETAASLQARGERAVNAEGSLRDQRINRVFEGATEIMYLALAREAMEEHQKNGFALFDPDVDLAEKRKVAANAAKYYAGYLPTLAVGKGHNPNAYGEYGTLAKHLRYIDRRSQRMARNVIYGLGRYATGMLHKQMFMSRIVLIGTELYAQACAIVAAERINSKVGGQQGEEAYALADAFCRQSRLRIDDHFTGLWKNTDELDRRLTGKMMDGNYSWLWSDMIDLSEGTGPWIADQTHGPSQTEDLRRDPYASV
ncbi:MAG: acyl-CoA dehydrogenase family protein [Jiangellales bacterium]